MKNVLIVMLILVVISTSVGISVRDSGLSYEHLLFHWVEQVENKIEVFKKSSDFLYKYFFHDDFKNYENYARFIYIEWLDDSGENDQYHFLVVGYNQNLSPMEFIMTSYGHDSEVEITDCKKVYEYFFFERYALYNAVGDEVYRTKGASIYKNYLSFDDVIGYIRYYSKIQNPSFFADRFEALREKNSITDTGG